MGEARAYYSEIDRDAVHVLRSLIADGLIADGDVDDRSIVDVRPEELVGYTQCHFFAGAGLWSVAARLAGWPDDRPLWTGSCPCQPFSAAGRGLGTDDPRHLWPDFFRLIRGARAGGFGPPVIMGEQVSGTPGYGWFDGVRADLAEEGFASRTRDIPACAVDAPHIRQRLYWIAVANAGSRGIRSGQSRENLGAPSRAREEVREQRVRPDAWAGGSAVAVANANSARPATFGRDVAEASGLQAAQRGAEDNAALSRGSDGPAARLVVDASRLGRREGRAEPELRSWRTAAAGADASGDLAQPEHCGCEGRDSQGSRPGAAYAPDRGHGRNGSAWAGADWLVCHDGKARRTEPGVRLLVDGMAGRVPAWRLAGNSISPVLAAEVIGAFLDVERAAA